MRTPITPLLCVYALTLMLESTAWSAQPVEKMELIGRVRVTYGDLDPEREADARVLLGRLQRAAYEACGGNPKLHPRYAVSPERTVAAYQECRSNALAQAVTSIHSVTLERLFRAGLGAPRSTGKD